MSRYGHAPACAGMTPHAVLIYVALSYLIDVAVLSRNTFSQPLAGTTARLSDSTPSEVAEGLC